MSCTSFISVSSWARNFSAHWKKVKIVKLIVKLLGELVSPLSVCFKTGVIKIPCVYLLTDAWTPKFWEFKKRSLWAAFTAYLGVRVRTLTFWTNTTWQQRVQGYCNSRSKGVLVVNRLMMCPWANTEERQRMKNISFLNIMQNVLEAGFWFLISEFKRNKDTHSVERRTDLYCTLLPKCNIHSE